MEFRVRICPQPPEVQPKKGSTNIPFGPRDLPNKLATATWQKCGRNCSDDEWRNLANGQKYLLIECVYHMHSLGFIMQDARLFLRGCRIEQVTVVMAVGD